MLSLPPPLDEFLQSRVNETILQGTGLAIWKHPYRGQVFGGCGGGGGGGGVSSPPPTVKFCLDMVLATRVSKGAAPKFSSATPTPILCRGRAPPLQRTSSPTHYAEVGTPQDSPLQRTSPHTLCRGRDTPGFPPSSIHPLPHIMQR